MEEARDSVEREGIGAEKTGKEDFCEELGAVKKALQLQVQEVNVNLWIMVHSGTHTSRTCPILYGFVIYGVR